MNSSIAKLSRVPLREVWKHEAHDFTTWLRDNIDVLNDALDISLTSAESEQSTGNFSVDLVAEDANGNTVIIENQLEKSNHDHLGKLLTYLTAIEAKKAVWIVASARPEHIKALAWLNESSSADFYLLKAEAVRIGNSAPAPLFTLIVGPSKESREAGKTKKELSERYTVREEFWKRLLEYAKTKTKLHANISPGAYSWVGTSAGKRGLGYNYSVREHDSAVELYIDRGADSQEENKSIFDTLFGNRSHVEQEFAGPLEWQRLEERRACRIRKRLDDGGWKDSEKWPKVYEKTVEAMMRLEKVLKPHIGRLRI